MLGCCRERGEERWRACSRVCSPPGRVWASRRDAERRPQGTGAGRAVARLVKVSIEEGELRQLLRTATARHSRTAAAAATCVPPQPPCGVCAISPGGRATGWAILTATPAASAREASNSQDIRKGGGGAAASATGHAAKHPVGVEVHLREGAAEEAAGSAVPSSERVAHRSHEKPKVWPRRLLVLQAPRECLILPNSLARLRKLGLLEPARIFEIGVIVVRQRNGLGVRRLKRVMPSPPLVRSLVVLTGAAATRVVVGRAVAKVDDVVGPARPSHPALRALRQQPRPEWLGFVGRSTALCRWRALHAFSGLRKRVLKGYEKDSSSCVRVCSCARGERVASASWG